ncbi:MAG: tetraacyldisaccharide 4'-kinase [Bacteroidales bacterium]|nr:tetraacyldisaccharide 4'-kinase [Bacteroidales bacterium]
MLIQRLILSLHARTWRKAPGAEVPAVCIGNITVGGTGKTPHTEMILRLLKELRPELRLAVLSRGYKRKSRGFQQVTCGSTASFSGDEPLQIKRKFPEVTVAVDKNRVEGCDLLVHPEKLLSGEKRYRRVADKEFPASDMIILDDAFQYRKLHASCNIVLVNWKRPIFSDSLLPFGRLRDLPSRIKDADMVVVTKSPHDLDEGDREQWRKILRLRDGQPLYFTTTDYDSPVPVFPEEADSRYNYSKTVILFSGIADDSQLKAYLSDTYKIVETINFPDHHAYSKADMARVAGAVHRHPTAALLTTEKDAVRVLDCKKLDDSIRRRLFAVPVRASFVEEADLADFSSRLAKL